MCQLSSPAEEAAEPRLQASIMRFLRLPGHLKALVLAWEVQETLLVGRRKDTKRRESGSGAHMMLRLSGKGLRRQRGWVGFR